MGGPNVIKCICVCMSLLLYDYVSETDLLQNDALHCGWCGDRVGNYKPIKTYKTTMYRTKFSTPSHTLPLRLGATFGFR